MMNTKEFLQNIISKNISGNVYVVFDDERSIGSGFNGHVELPVIDIFDDHRTNDIRIQVRYPYEAEINTLLKGC